MKMNCHNVQIERKERNHKNPAVILGKEKYKDWGEGYRGYNIRKKGAVERELWNAEDGQ